MTATIPRRVPGPRSAAAVLLLAALAIVAPPVRAAGPAGQLPDFDAAGSGLPAKGAELEALIEAVEDSLLRRPEDAHLLALLGQCYFKRGSYEWRAFGVRRLRAALEYAPSDVEVQLALAYALTAQGFTDYARDALTAAVRLAPERPEPHLELGRSWFRSWRVTRADEELRDKARDHLARAFVLDPSRAQTAVPLALLDRAADDPSAARSTVRISGQSGGGSAELHLLEGVLAFEDERMEQAAEAFGRGLSLLPAADRAAFRRIDLLVPVEEAAQLTAKGEAERAEYERRFWQAHDPTPTTEANERWMEHLARVFLADAFFGVPKLGLRGWETARGKAWIRYGQPQSEMYTVEAAVFGKWDCPTQRWFYETGQGSFMLTFQDRSLNEEYDLPHDLLGGGAVEMAAVVERAMPEKPSWRYPGREEPLVVDACRFRAPEGTELALFFQVPPGEVFRAEKRIAVFDADWRPLERRAEFVNYAERRDGNEDDGRRTVDALRCALPAGAYHVAMDVEDEDQSLLLSWESEVVLEDLRADSLTSSDLVLLESVRPALGGEPFARGGLALEPRPDRRFERGEPIHVYMELYGLRASEDQPRSYVIEYRLDSLEKPPDRGFFLARWVRGLLGREKTHAVSYRFERRARAETVIEHYVLDVSTLPPGGMILTIGVTDGRTGQQVARSSTFEVTERP